MRSRAKLDPAEYRKLHRQVLERDVWRCQNCGSMRGLQVHHLKFRSHVGDDAEPNLITLCQDCHRGVHNSNPISAHKISCDMRPPIASSRFRDD
jgi:5-methylcytosine-specific restriction endonuclease McrA